MSELSASSASERHWARSHFRLYLLRRLDEAGEERLHAALPLVPGLVDDLRDAEERLIQGWLDGELDPHDGADFERYYVNGTESNRIKLKLHRSLRLPEARLAGEPTRTSAAPLPVRRPIARAWVAATVAATILMCVFGWLWFRTTRQNSRLRDELARLQSPRTMPVEQPAGASPDGGLLLPASGSEIRLTVSTAPSRLIWSPVPDYRSQYRIRVRSSGGRESTSPPLTPRENAVEYALDHASQLPLPWDVSVLGPGGPGGKVLAHYTLVEPGRR